MLEDSLSEIDPDGLEVLTLAEVSQRRRPRIEDVMCGNIIANRRIRDREDLRGSRTPDADLTGSLLLVGIEVEPLAYKHPLKQPSQLLGRGLL